jgi:hypothetical protein
VCEQGPFSEGSPNHGKFFITSAEKDGKRKKERKKREKRSGRGGEGS